ncbi:MAG: thiamine diphosphokinase [Ilumatobacteraceae bacterium]
MSQVVVVIGGGPLSSRAIAEIAPTAVVVAADSGLDHAVAAGLRPTILVGDLDSISAHGKMWAYAHELEIDQHPQDKGSTDTELALARATATDATQLLVCGASGDRFDHALGTLAALGNPTLSRFDSVRLLLDGTAIHVLHRDRSVDLDLAVGSPFSLLSLHGTCAGIEVTGARWPLTGAEFEPWSTLGISNEATGLLHVAVSDGILTLVVP